MEFTLGLAQCRHRADGDAVALVREYARQARSAGVDFIVFPESLMSRYEMDRGDFAAASQPLGGPFSRAVEGIAREFGLWMIYTMNERNDADGLPFNTAVLVDDGGARRGVYRKAHLFDTDSTKESSRMSAGGALFDPVSTPFGTIGMAICYDLRFPEVTRRAALAGCDVMVFPAAWVDGPGKVRQWKALLAARAIENQLYTVGVSRCDEGYIGHSCAFAPDGAALVEAGPQEGLFTCSVDAGKLVGSRRAMPVLDHRRPELYGL